MTNELIRKLSSALSKQIEEECQVVYILSKIRKILEKSGRDKIFLVLDFYIDWSLHAQIERTSRISHILEKIEKTILNSKYDPFTAMELLNFDEFRKEAVQFFGEHNIMHKFTEKDYWMKFRTFMVDILADCPLKINRGEINELTFIKSDKNNVKCKINFKSHQPIMLDFDFLNY